MMLRPAIILIAMITSVFLSSIMVQTVMAGTTADDPGVQGQQLQVAAGRICDGNRACERDFVSTANQCANMSGSNTGQGVTACIINRIGSQYNLDGKRSQIIQEVEAAFAFQSTTANRGENTGDCKGSILGFPAWYNGLPCENGSPKITNLNQIWIIVLNAVRWLLGAAAYGAAIFIIWGGFKYIKSQGDPSAIASAKTTIVQAVGGLGIALISNLLVAWLVGLFS